MANREKSKYAPFWVIIIVLLLILAILVLSRDLFSGSESVSQDPPPASTEWAPAPESGVDVELPQTPMRNVEEPGPGAADEETPAQAQ